MLEDNYAPGGIPGIRLIVKPVSMVVDKLRLLLRNTSGRRAVRDYAKKATFKSCNAALEAFFSDSRKTRGLVGARADTAGAPSVQRPAHVV